MRESDIQKAICDYLVLMPGLWWRNNSVGVYDPTRRTFRTPRGSLAMNGTADILGVYKGRFYAIEVKAPKGYQSASQKEFEAKVTDNGGVYLVARSIDDVMPIFHANPK